MGFKLTLSALEDVENIARYTLENWNAAQGEKYLDKLDAGFQQLAENPKLGRYHDELKKGVYSFPIGSHLAFYRIQENHIEILAILHKSMDAQRHL